MSDKKAPDLRMAMFALLILVALLALKVELQDRRLRSEIQSTARIVGILETLTERSLAQGAVELFTSWEATADGTTWYRVVGDADPCGHGVVARRWRSASGDFVVHRCEQ